jgi:phenylacetic acid degradation operon negative regulatory protein
MDDDDRDDRRASAKSLLTTMLGEFVLPQGGGFWTTTAVAGLDLLGITERNCRQALARLRDQGMIRPERHGRTVRWWLTEAATKLLTTGAERIYSFGSRAESWDGHWLVVMCSIPERQRAKRHRLRTQLTFEGFGFVAPSVAVCPHRDREEAANQILRELGLEFDALTLDARTGPLTPDLRMVESAWQLDALAGAYEGFIDEFAGLAPSTPAEAFAGTIRLVDAWRHFPFVDPELPVGLLPAGWPGHPARELFAKQRRAWSRQALTWYQGFDG